MEDLPMKINRTFFISLTNLLCCLTFFFIALDPVMADAETEHSVRLAPTRVILEGRARAATVRLINPNATERRYRISLVSVRMDETGVRQIVNEPSEAERFAQSLIRFSPRQVTIPGGGSQVVRLMVQKPNDLAPGEYRAHFMVSPVPEAKSGKNRDAGQSPKKIGISIDIRFQVSIPILIRQGGGKSEGIVRTPILKKQEKGEGVDLTFTLERTGPFSLLSDIRVYRMAGKTGGKEKIGEVQGIPSYTPVTRQRVTIPLAIGRNLKTFADQSLVIDIHDCEKEGKPLVRSTAFPDLFRTSIID